MTELKKTFLIAIKDGDDISAIFENLSAEGNDIEKIVNPLSESKLMKKNLTLIINTMNEELSKTLNVEISEVDSGLDLSQEKQTVVDVLKLIISLYPEFSDGVSDEILEENYNSIGELLNKMLSSKLSEGVFTNTYNGFIEYLQTSEEYGQRITFLLSEYENEQDVNWIEILSIAIDSKNYTSGEISDDLKNKLASLVETVYNDEQCGDIMATLIEIMNNFITIDNATAETSLQLLIDTFADLEQYNDDYEKVHKVITFTSKITGATALDEIKNITNFTTEKQRYTQLLDTLDEFNESPSVQALESLISQLSEADFAVDTMIKNDIVFDVDDTYKTAVSEYIDNNIEDETVSANLKTIFAI